VHNGVATDLARQCLGGNKRHAYANGRNCPQQLLAHRRDKKFGDAMAQILIRERVHDRYGRNTGGDQGGSHKRDGRDTQCVARDTRTIHPVHLLPERVFSDSWNFGNGLDFSDQLVAITLAHAVKLHVRRIYAVALMYALLTANVQHDCANSIRSALTITRVSALLTVRHHRQRERRHVLYVLAGYR